MSKFLGLNVLEALICANISCFVQYLDHKKRKNCGYKYIIRYLSTVILHKPVTLYKLPKILINSNVL